MEIRRKILGTATGNSVFPDAVNEITENRILCAIHYDRIVKLKNQLWLDSYGRWFTKADTTSHQFAYRSQNTQ